MIIKIIKYTVVFLLGAMVMATNKEFYDATHSIFNDTEDYILELTNKERKKQ